jgi:polyisoprenoid-binding protein YceI
MKKMHFLPAAAVAVLMASCGQQPGAPANKPGQSAASAPEADVKLVVPAGEYKLDKTHALLEFSVSHMGLSNYTPRFGDFDSTINLDPVNLENSSVNLTVNLASVSTLYPGDYAAKKRPFKSWDDQLANDPGFFNAREFATATFKSTKVEKSGPRNAKVTGDFTLRGVTKPVTFDVTLIGQAEKAMMTKLPAFGVRAEGMIQPADFGMQGMLAAKPVKILFDGEFHPAGAAEAEAAAVKAGAGGPPPGGVAPTAAAPTKG